MTDRISSSEPNTGDTTRRWFRAVVGLISLASGLIGLVALFFVTIPTPNQQPILIGLGVVLGWGSSVVQSEFGGSTTGRRLAERAADQFSRSE